MLINYQQHNVSTVMNDNDLMKLIRDAYCECIKELKSAPLYFDIYDKILMYTVDNCINIITYRGVPMDKFEALNILEDVLMIEKIYHIDRYLKAVNNAQIIMIRSLL